jgi:anti-sigma28 factor (negative regulator of flagellin synthesis)
MPSHPQDETPEPRDPIREARLAALRKSIANGTYKVPSGEVADKLIEEMLRKP